MRLTFHHVFIFACKNIRRMCECGTKPKLTKRCLLVATLAGALGSATAIAQAPQSSGQTYHILVRGYYSGEGTATASGDLVTIQASVRNDQNIAISINATCTLTGDHFTGTTVVPGGTMVIQGRVEQPDPNAGKANSPTGGPTPDPIVQHSRIGALYIINHLHGGRLSGTQANLQ